MHSRRRCGSDPSSEKQSIKGEFYDTGIPGMVGGYTKERVIHSPAEGILRNVSKITDTVKQGEIIAVIETKTGNVPVEATIDGLLRGLIRDG